MNGYHTVLLLQIGKKSLSNLRRAFWYKTLFRSSCAHSGSKKGKGTKSILALMSFREAEREAGQGASVRAGIKPDPRINSLIIRGETPFL
jgi:hypothetical protein